MITATKFRSLKNVLCSLYLLLSVFANAQQKPGYINRPATNTTGISVLDPNNDGYTSSSTAGFSGSDVTGSEISFTSIPTFNKEPYGDLRRGPDHLYSDFVPDNGDNGVYMTYRGGNLLFRYRVGSVMSGSKGYSILIDTDEKFGATGTNADPNYQSATTGTNGNPGFEVEVILETNFRIAIYNVDGSSTPILIKQYTNWQEMSQVSIAATSDNGDPDFLIDFYIPFTDLMAAPFNLATTTKLRLSATTVMSPQAAIGGPKSDIYGLNDDSYSNTNAQYEAYIDAQPSFSINNLSSGIGSMCTAAPVVNGPIGTGTPTITGTWTKFSLTGAASTADITIYRDGTEIGTKTGVTSGSTWTFTVPAAFALVNGHKITAKAKASSESMCLTSNTVTASSCNSGNRPAKPVLNCTGNNIDKGITGTNLSTGWTVHVDNITYNNPYNNVTDVSTSTFTAPTGTSPNLTWRFSGGCTNGSPMTEGSYKIYYTDNNNGGCASEPVFVCVPKKSNSTLGTSTTGLPSITTPSPVILTTATKAISGSAEIGSTVSLYIDGTLASSTPASSGTYSFSNLNFLQNQNIYIVNELNTGTASSSKCAAQTSTYTITCFTSVPIISGDSKNEITAGAPITGTSSEPIGTTIYVYNSTSTAAPVATVTVQSNGTWTTAPYNAQNGVNYFANAQNGSCGVSGNSSTVSAISATASTRCGSITGPISSSVSSISGGLTTAVANTNVILYLDGVSIGSASTNTTSWGPIPVNTNVNNTLYSNGVLTIGVQELGKQEVLCSNSVTISCSPSPATFTVSPTSRSVAPNQTTTYTIDNAVAGNYYGIAESVTGTSLGGVWATANGSLVITTKAYSSEGNYNINIKASSLSGVTLCYAASSTSVTMNVQDLALPVHLIEFKGKRESATVLLNWIVESEVNFSRYEIERSANGANFYKIGEKIAIGTPARTSYSYRDMQPMQGGAYYRLRMIDIDGKFTFSKVIAISGNGANVSLSAIRPNPFYDNIEISLSLEEGQSVRLNLVDGNGRSVGVQTLNGSIGLNEVTFSNLSNLPAGIYMLVVSTQGGEIKQKLVKFK